MISPLFSNHPFNLLNTLIPLLVQLPYILLFHTSFPFIMCTLLIISVHAGLLKSYIYMQNNLTFLSYSRISIHSVLKYKYIQAIIIIITSMNMFYAQYCERSHSHNICGTLSRRSSLCENIIQILIFVIDDYYYYTTNICCVARSVFLSLSDSQHQLDDLS